MKFTSASPALQTSHPLLPYLFIIPACVVVGTFVIYPALKAILLSFTNFNMIRDADFIGLTNYINIWNDPFFWMALKNTLLYMLVVVPVLVFAPIFLAALVNKHIPGIAFFRAAIYLPVITSLVISGLIWKWVYEEKGILNYLLITLSITDTPIAFLTDPANALFLCDGSHHMEWAWLLYGDLSSRVAIYSASFVRSR